MTMGSTGKTKDDTLRGLGTLRGVGKPQPLETTPVQGTAAACEDDTTSREAGSDDGARKKSQRLVAQNRTVPPQWINPSPEDRRKYGIPDPPKRASTDAADIPKEPQADSPPQSARKRGVLIVALVIGVVALLVIARAMKPTASEGVDSTATAPTATAAPPVATAATTTTVAEPATASPSTTQAPASTVAAVAPSAHSSVVAPPTTSAPPKASGTSKPPAPQASSGKPRVPDEIPF